MQVKAKTEDHWRAKRLIEEAFEGSRFIMDIQVKPDNSRLDIYMIRLIQSKDYCGSHPEACQVRPWVKQRHMKRTWLEGADWVDFNDRLNDVLDKNYIEARVQSSVCVIRMGLRRRIYYGSFSQGFGFEWVKRGEDEDYKDYTGRYAPNSEYPYGTPGEYTREGVQI